MKRTVALGIFSLVLIIAFAAVLVGSILSVSVQNAGGENLTLDIPDSVGTGTVDTPLTKRQLQKKYAKYNIVTEENGKTAVTIFSDEQIDDFNKRREKGEWFWLSTEEMLFLIEDTISLFETYDIVYIRGLDGVLHKYYGLSFFSSEEYFASFGGFDLGVTDASFDLKQDVYETILERCTSLNSAAVEFPNRTPYLYLDLTEPLTDQQIANIAEWKNPFWNSAKRFGVVLFEFDSIFYFRQSPNNDTIGSVNRTTLYSRDTSFDSIGYYRFDKNSEKVVVVELYEESSKKIIARLRFDSENAPSVLSQFEEHYSDLLLNQSNSGIIKNITSYRVVIYLNGFTSDRQPAHPIHYCPVDTLDLFCYMFGTETFLHGWLYLQGSEKLANFTNDLLNKYLSTDF